MKNLIGVILSVAVALLLSLSCERPRTMGDDAETASRDNEGAFDNRSMDADTEFAVSAADGAMLEIQLGKLAQGSAASPEVKRLAQLMVDDHSRAHEELKTLAASKNISLPTSMSERNQKKLDAFANKTGEDFDKDFAEFIVKDHKDDLDKFRKQAEMGNDPEIKSWAAGKVTILEHHLAMAEDVERSVRNGSLSQRKY